METLSIEELSVVLNIELSEMFVRATKLNKDYNLGIENYYKLTRTQYDVIRSVFDTGHLVSLLRGEKSDRKYSYNKTPVWRDLVSYLSEYNLNGFSTADIKATLPSNLKRCGTQTVAAAMRSIGYESKVMYLEKGKRKQGRRWNKYDVTPISFL